MERRIFAFALSCLAAACAESQAVPGDNVLGPPDASLPREAGASDGGRTSDGAATDPDSSSSGDASGASDASDAGRDAQGDAAADASEAGATIVAPVADGVVNAGEYGTHVDGQNQQTSDHGATAWLMTWDDTNLYVAVTSANVAEAVVLYVDANPLAQLAGGTNADGSLAGYGYDTVAAALPLRADFVAYAKSTYNEVRHADGSNSWGAPAASAITNVGTGATREMVIPWTAIRSAGRPASFAWMGYVVTNGSQYVYGEMPPANPGAAVGATVAMTHAYVVSNATPGVGTKPFANAVMP